MDNLKVTVLMSVYNGEKYLREAIDSILNQTFTDFEFLIVNDASTDGSMRILQSYDDTRIRIINNENNIGLTKSLNKGMSFSKGTYIARMDADDISYPERLEIQYHYMENNPDVGVVGSWTEVIDENGNTIDFWKCPYSSEEIYYILNFRNCLTHSSVMFRKDFIVHYGGYDETIDKAQDYELWNRISKTLEIVQIQELLVKWRRGDNLIDSNKRQKQNHTVDVVVKNNFEQLVNKKTEENIYLIVKDNFEATCAVNFKNLSENDLLASIKLFFKVNEQIAKKAPCTLNKQIIKKIGDKKLIKYLRHVSINIKLIDLLNCIYSHIDGNLSLKIVLLGHIIYTKIRYT